ncbi:MAG: serine dehydrogenasease [Bacteroidetes bacterium]|nr:serine dehydrogenasease [Bacteroidota bacterium]
MDFLPNDSLLKAELNKRLLALEGYLSADVMSFSGAIHEGLSPKVLGVIEDLANTPDKKDTLYIILTTTGGSAHAVDIYVNIIRHHYKTVNFIVPDYAYSAGTIFCMSGDNIYMDYYSVLGPIDPQVQNKDGRWVAALGYLDKIKELLDKAKAIPGGNPNGSLTNAEFLILKDFDLAELRGYEQARDLTIDLLKNWLVQYKFKNWTKHESNPKLLGQTVTVEQKINRAEGIAKDLGDTSKWKSHGRPINLQTLRDMKLKVEDFGMDATLKELVRSYYNFLRDYTGKFQSSMAPQTRDQFNFLHTRTFI